MKRLAVILSLALLAANNALAESATIVCPADAPANVKLAAKELRRYVYLRTGELATISENRTYANDRTSVSLMVDPALGAQEYRLKSDGQTLAISGGSEIAVLYGAYAFAEKLGIRFSLHGDMVPDGKIAFALPKLDETRQPLFALRGIQPFHDFAEGPDWWNADDYKAYCTQLAKMKMNFIGLHCYPLYPPWSHVPPEPGTWIGLPGDSDARGRVSFSYPTSWANTARQGPGCGVAWGYFPNPTSNYRFGAADLFEADDYGAEVMQGLMPQPKTPEQCNELFNRTGELFRDVFGFAKTLGINSCLGTESPLIIPNELRARIAASGRNPDDPAVLREIYEGTFQRVMKAHPVDYFWFWTPERDINPATTQADLLVAVDAWKKVKPPFELAICGWGWLTHNFERFHQAMPKEMVFSCINDQLGHAPVATNFAQLGDRPHWVIPWMEDDTPMVLPQLWVGRVRKDAADALKYGSGGLMGIHWRTRAISPNLMALAEAGWSQAGWGSKNQVNATASPDLARIGGQPTDYPDNPIAEAHGNERIYQTCRYGDMAYSLAVPNGTYEVTLCFAEIHYAAPGKRVFGARLNGQTVIERLDVFAEVGKNQALDRTFKGIEIKDGRLKLEFTPIVEFPFIAGIVISGQANASAEAAAHPYLRKIDCGGTGAGDFEGELPGAAGRMLESASFYADWCRSQFGEAAGAKAAPIFAANDGRMPRCSTWANNGPGAVGGPDGRPWATAEKDFAFVREFAALRPLVTGAGNLERFDYWRDQFLFMQAMGKVRCAQAELDRRMQALAQAEPAARPDALAAALAARRELLRDWTEMATNLLQTVSTPGELGTVANLESHSRIGMNQLARHDAALEKALGGKLPADLQPATAYAGKPRLIVPTVRSVAKRGEPLKLKIIVLDRQPVKSVVIKLRPLGKGDWRILPAQHLARGVWTATLPAATEDFEYQIEAETADGKKLAWPATAPQLNQTVVVTE